MRNVCQLTASHIYHLYMSPVDMRKSFHGLQGLITESFGNCISIDDVFVFIGKNRKTMKVFHREANGITLYIRRLAIGCFQMPKWEEDGETCLMEYKDFVLMCLGEGVKERVKSLVV